MNQHELEALSDDEMIVAVAEAKGWKIKLCEERQTFDANDYLDLLIRDYALISPKNQPIVKKRTNKMAGFIKYLPDYRQPSEYMVLMEGVWSKIMAHLSPTEIIMFTGAGGGVSAIRYQSKDTRWRAIAIAWLMICGGENG